VVTKLKPKIKNNKLSVKMAFTFFSVTFIIEITLFFILYFLVINSMVAQEINNLLYRGDGYARMMQGDFTEKNINNAINTGIDDHSAMVIENNTKQIIKSSRKIDNEMLKHISELQNNDRNVSESLDFHWVGDKYAATSSPIFEKNKKIGTIYMFLDRSYIQQLIFNFSKVFILIVLLSLLITILLLVYLSKVITSPLIKIKEGAEKITQGNYSLSLDINTNDELQDLAHSIEELSTKLNLVEKERNEFLASIAHELRTPLTFIRGYADILKRPTITSFDKLEYITIIQEETDRLTQLLENLMMLAQLEEHEFKINKIEVNLKPFIENVKKKSSTFLSQKNISLELKGIGSISAIFDPTRMEQVLINLLMNAFKYSKENSKIILEVKQSENFITFIVRDEGEGIAEHELKHIFDHFYRIDKSRTRKSGGGGLGLAIVKQITELHEGRIFVNSKLNCGTEIQIIIPSKKTH